jgi:hypothetical protein
MRVRWGHRRRLSAAKTLRDDDHGRQLRELSADDLSLGYLFMTEPAGMPIEAILEP